MAGETTLTVVGNLTSDPELRFTPGGAAVCSFTVASTARAYNKQSQQWEDDPNPLFLRCSIWRQAAEHVAESLQKGARVIVQGRLKQRTFEKDGQKRTVVELDVDEIGPSLKYATAKVVRAARGGEGVQQQGGGYGQQAQRGPAQAPEDPWAQAAGAPYSDSPPF